MNTVTERIGRFTHITISSSKEYRLPTKQIILQPNIQVQRMYIKMFPLITTAKWMALCPLVCCS
jgi:hypothetical protein